VLNFYYLDLIFRPFLSRLERGSRDSRSSETVKV